MKSLFTAANDDEEPLRLLRSFFSLLEDIAWNILSRLRKSILSAMLFRRSQVILFVHWHFTKLGVSSVKIQSFLSPKHPRKWFSICKNSQRDNRLVSVGLLNHYHREPVYAVIAIGPEIFIITGSANSSLWIFDPKITRFVQDRVSACINRTECRVRWD